MRLLAPVPFTAELPMWLLMLSLVVQTPTPRQVLEAEHARSADISVLMRAARGNDQTLRARAVRAIGPL